MIRNVMFSVFKYHLSTEKTEVPMSWDPDDDVIYPAKFPTLEAYFEALLPKKNEQLPIWDKARTAKASVTEEMMADDKSRGRDAKDYHRADILEHKENIIVLSIQANGSKRYTDRNNVEHRMPHYPSTLVVIDNREGQQLIAIEKTRKD